tara:strand:- start:31703 stop:32623 length:921 start_codon:yes stop_codon:yes gene_type:complete
MKLQNIAIMPIFVSVIEQNSFSGAAKKLGITKSAVSKRITMLEETLGVKLIQRSTRRLHLTEAGERYFKLAQIATDCAVEAEHAASELQTSPKGNLKINIPMSFGRLHIIPIIPEFLKRFPDITIKLEMSDEVTDIIAQGVDIAIRGGELPDSSLIAKKITPLRNILCASEEYLQLNGIPKTPEDLKNHNCILYSNQPNAKEWIFIKGGKTRAIKVDGTFQANNSEAIKHALIEGIGIGRLPTFVTGNDLNSQNLKQVLPEFTMPEKTLYALFPEKKYMPTKIRVFIDFIHEKLGGHIPYWDRTKN